jgi:hypothetical protein
MVDIALQSISMIRTKYLNIANLLETGHIGRMQIYGCNWNRAMDK